jgi:RNA polymerase sigma-70 factor (ECF subfamily)
MDATRENPTSRSPASSLEQLLTDEQLLVRYRNTGDRELFARLVRRYERELYSYLRRYLGDAEMAEDAFQATFLQVHLKCEQFEEDRRVRPWLYTIATNQAIDARRRNKRHVMVSLDRTGARDAEVDAGKLVDLLVSADADPLDQVDSYEQRERMQDVLDQLPDHMYAVIHLVYYQGMKYREAADVLSIPVGTVKSRLHAAIHRLADVWKNTHPPVPEHAVPEHA